VGIVDIVMKRIVFVLGILFLMGMVVAVPETQLDNNDQTGQVSVSYFYSVSCSHCKVVAESGVLDRAGDMEGVDVEKFEITGPVNRERFLDYLDKFGINGGGIPFVVVEQGGSTDGHDSGEPEFSYLAGDSPIIEDLEDSILNFRAFDAGGVDVVSRDLGLWVVIGAALIDSINPCAFGVLLFLMAVLLTMGSAKRALKSGLVYTFVIFCVYLLAGLGIMRFAGDFLALDNVRVFVGVIILIGAGLEFKDFFWAADGMTLVSPKERWWNISLAIPKGAKPWLEKCARRGTFMSLIVLGALVALVELPCTGGIYLAILSLIADSGVKGIFYLVLYNVVFVLPLILISYFVYHGTKVEVVNEWVQRNKRFMRLAAGIVMLGLAGSLLGVF